MDNGSDNRRGLRGYSAAAVPEKPGVPADGKKGMSLLWLWPVAVAVCLVLYAANLFLGDVNQDEGWYLYGARLVAEGKKPYLDFGYTQGPLMPYVYSAANPLVERWGVAGGRAFTALLGLAGVFLTALLAGRLAPAGRRNAAALMAFALVGVNVYQTYFTAIVKTYSLTAIFLMTGFCLLAYGWKERGRGHFFLAGVFIAMAVATRASAAVILPVVAAGLIAGDVRRRFVDAVYFALGAALAGAVIFLPFLMKAPDVLWFWLVQYHSSKSGGTLRTMLALKAGFISRVVQGYFVAAGACMAVVLYRFIAAGPAGFAGRMRAVLAPASGGERSYLPHVIWTSVACVSMLHLMTPFPYDDYQALIYPLFAAAVAASLAGFAETPVRRGWLTAGIFLLCVASAFSSPINQRWFIAGRDRIWWPIKKETPLRMLHRIGHDLKQQAGPDRVLFTQDAYLAVESGLVLPHGLELGPFSYYPDFDRKKAERLNVLNKELMVELIRRTDAKVAACSEYGFAIKAPEVVELPADEQKLLYEELEKRFTAKREINGFGQGDTRLIIYEVK